MHHPTRFAPSSFVSTVIRAAAGAGSLCLALAGCSGDGDTPNATSTSTSTSASASTSALETAVPLIGDPGAASSLEPTGVSTASARLSPLSLSLPQGRVCPELPSGAGINRYVSPSGSDANDGLARGRALKSVGVAMQAARPGDVIHLANGVYREGIETGVGGTAAAPITLRAEAGASPVVSGSAVATGWTRHNGPVWQLPWNPNQVVTGYSGPEVVTRKAPQQVFVNGAPLQQVAGVLDAVHPACPDATRDWCRRAVGTGLGDVLATPGSFFFDAASQMLYLHLADGSAPSGHMVEVAQHRRVLFFYPNSTGHVCVEGLTFRHGNGSAHSRQMAAVTLPSHGTLANSTVEWNDLAGVSIGSNGRLLYSLIRHNGQLGMITTATRVSVRSNILHGNNRRGFNPLWEAGALKMTSGATGQVVGNHAYDNDGPGVWLDFAVGTRTEGVQVDGNYLHGNAGEAQILVEVTPNAQVMNNIVVNDGRAANLNLRAIYFSESRQGTMAFNTVLKTAPSLGLEGSSGSRGGMDGLAVYGNLLLNLGTLSNNRPDYRIKSTAPYTSDENLFFRRTGRTVFETVSAPVVGLPAWRSASLKDARSLETDPRLVETGPERFQVPCTSAAQQVVTHRRAVEVDLLGVSRVSTSGATGAGAFHGCLK